MDVGDGSLLGDDAQPLRRGKKKHTKENHVSYFHVTTLCMDQCYCNFKFGVFVPICMSQVNGLTSYFNVTTLHGSMLLSMFMPY